MGKRPHVVIIGAGFGGLAAAKKLRKKPIDVTIIDRHNYHTFQPLLYQVATAGLEPVDVGYPVRGIFQRAQNVNFKLGEVTGIDWDAKQVSLQNEDAVAFDYLIIAAGSVTNFFNLPGAAEFAYPLYTLPNALLLRNHLLSLFEAADSIEGLVDDGALNVVVVGGGPTGIEVSGAISALIHKVLAKDYHDLPVDRARVILVEGSDRLLAAFDESLQQYTLKALEKRGVEVELGKTVSEIALDHVTFADGSSINTRLVVWAAGVGAAELASKADFDQGRGGRINVDAGFRVAGHPNVYAVGDVANADDGKGEMMPQLAQPAIQGGRYVAKEILADVAAGGSDPKPFSYRDKGIMATIGRSAAVAQLPIGLKMRGWIAWMSWMFLHLMYIFGARNRISVLFTWTWAFFTWDAGPRLILRAETPPKGRKHVESSGPASPGAGT